MTTDCCDVAGKVPSLSSVRSAWDGVKREVTMGALVAFAGGAAAATAILAATHSDGVTAVIGSAAVAVCNGVLFARWMYRTRGILKDIPGPK